MKMNNYYAFFLDVTLPSIFLFLYIFLYKKILGIFNQPLINKLTKDHHKIHKIQYESSSILLAYSAVIRVHLTPFYHQEYLLTHNISPKVSRVKSYNTKPFSEELRRGREVRGKGGLNNGLSTLCSGVDQGSASNQRAISSDSTRHRSPLLASPLRWLSETGKFH